MKTLPKVLLVAVYGFMATTTACADTNFGVDLPRLFRDGEVLTSTPPLQNPQALAGFEEQMRTMSKSTEPIQYLWTIQKMKQQPDCGRFLMVPVQGKIALAPFALGGFICANGTPPLQICPETPKKLVTPGTICKSGKPAEFTKEAKALYEASIKRGAKTPVEAGVESDHAQK